jgi:hypothetical protein
MNIVNFDIWTVFLGIITIISFVIAVYQTIVMEKTRKINKKLERANEELQKANEQNCLTRCKTIARITEELAANMGNACTVVKRTCVEKGKPCIYLAAKIDDSINVTKRLIDYCNELNAQHLKEFGHSVGIDMSNLLQYKECLTLEGMTNDDIHD